MTIQKIIEQTRETDCEFCFRLAQHFFHRADDEDHHSRVQLAIAYRKAADMINAAACLVSEENR